MDIVGPPRAPTLAAEVPSHYDGAMREHVCIVGTGQMAVMCATLLCDNGHEVTLLGRWESIREIRRTRRSAHLPDVTLPQAVKATPDPRSLADATLVASAIPTQTLAGNFGDFRAAGVRFDVPVVSCAKGVELGTMRRPTEVIAQASGAGIVAALSGPNIAAEVVRRKPAGAVVACEDGAVAERVRAAFATDYFRVYTNSDVIGVELAGALKNVIALVAGIVDGLDLGNNAKASIITRGIVEITRLGVAMGAKAETFYGLAGLGDLITTCVSPEGRNRTVGERVGRGERLDDVLASLGSVCEGVPTTRAVQELARRRGLEMPIVAAIHSVLFEGKDVRAALSELMTREPKAERM